MKLFNLVLSGGGVKSYAHLGVYKYCFERGVEFNEIVAVSGGALIAPFIFLQRHPDGLIDLFKKANIHRMLFPFWFVPDQFEFLLVEPSTSKLGKWVEKELTKSELNKIQNTKKLHIMATRKPMNGSNPSYTDMLTITSLKDALAATCAISGIFKAHKIGRHCYIDGAHWNNTPIFFDFEDALTPLIAVNVSTPPFQEETKGKLSKIFRGVEISSYARFQEDLKRWEEGKVCNQRGELYLINPTCQNINSLDFDINEKQIEELIDIGYSFAKEALNTSTNSSIFSSNKKVFYTRDKNLILRSNVANS